MSENNRSMTRTPDAKNGSSDKETYPAYRHHQYLAKLKGAADHAECIALIITIAIKSSITSIYLYHEDGRSALHPAHVFQHLDEYRNGAYRQDNSCQEHGVIERPAKLCAPTAKPSPRITRTSITAMPVPPFLLVARSWFGVGMQARTHRAGAQ